MNKVLRKPGPVGGRAASAGGRRNRGMLLSVQKSAFGIYLGNQFEIETGVDKTGKHRRAPPRPRCNCAGVARSASGARARSPCERRILARGVQEACVWRWPPVVKSERERDILRAFLLRMHACVIVVSSWRRAPAPAPAPRRNHGASCAARAPAPAPPHGAVADPEDSDNEANPLLNLVVVSGCRRRRRPWRR